MFSDVSPFGGGQGPQLRSHGPVSQHCASCTRQVELCVCATPSTSGITIRRTRPKKKAIDSSTLPASAPCRQLFKEATTDNVKAEEGNEALNEELRVGGRTRHNCPQCPKTFGSPGKLSQHLYAHTGERPFVCQQCDKAFSSRFKLVRHTLIHSDQRQYRCLSCDRTFHRKDHLKNHSKVHSPVKLIYKCERQSCGKEYSSPVSYRKHVAVHAAEDGNLECTICGKICSTKEETVLHLKVHAGSRTIKTQADRKYRCDKCDRSFFTGKDVRRHLVVHTGKRDFLCQFCPQKFGRKDHLIRHIRKSHNTAGKKGKKRIEPKTKSVTAILAEASTSRVQELVQDIKSESKSSFTIFDVEDTTQPSTSGTADVPFSPSILCTDEELSETSGSMMSDKLYQSQPPPYSLSGLPSTSNFDPGDSSEGDIKPELMSEYITLLPQQFEGPLPPNLLLTTTDSTDLPDGQFMEPVVESSLHQQFLQMSNFIAPETSQASTSGTDLIIPDFVPTSDSPTVSTPLPRFNQAFHQPP